MVGTHLLPRYWHETAATPSLPPRNILAQNPMGCVAVSIRIGPDGTPHQIQIIKAWCKPMLPVYVQMMDARVVHALRGAHFVPGSINAQRRPVYSYVVQAYFEQSAYSLHPSRYTQQRIRMKSAYLQRLCHVPRFVARIARAVGTGAPTPE